MTGEEREPQESVSELVSLWLGFLILAVVWTGVAAVLVIWVRVSCSITFRRTRPWIATGAAVIGLTALLEAAMAPPGG